MSEPTPAESEDVTETFYESQEHPDEPESLPGRALMIAVMLAGLILVALVIFAVVVFVAP
jgi:hypothetical protein